MFQMMGVFAEFERAMIQERVRAGLARGQERGKRLGRPRIAPELEERIRKALFRFLEGQVLRADIIFGENRGLSYARHKTAPALRSVITF
jgi:DNA invertase Pin-like site-specific DNA recombinase